MSVPATVRAQVDAALSSLWSAIQTKEDTYFAANGVYWEGLRTHSVLPADGATALPDIGTTCPSYQPGQPWPNAVLTTAMPMAVQVSQYTGPFGSGYQATVLVTINGVTHTRTAQVGPETYRAQPWAQAT